MNQTVTSAGLDVPAEDLARVLDTFLGAQRWFGGKGRGGQVARVQDVGRLDDGSADAVPVALWLVDVAYPEGDVETYQLPVSVRTDPADVGEGATIGRLASADGQGRWVYDALHDRVAAGLWLDAIIPGTQRGAVRFVHDEHATTPEPRLPSRLVSTEQSNTSVIYGDDAILKVFRKVSEGHNPDIEIHAALGAAECPYIAPILGWVEAVWTDPQGNPVTGSLAMLQSFLRSATDGWEMAKASMRDLLAEADLHADEVGGDFAGEASRLGAATAEVHAALAATLPTARADADDIAEQATAMRSRLSAAAEEVPALAPLAAALDEAYQALRSFEGDIELQRVHGDYHLGQVMRTTGGWRLLDFEGEPAKTLPERRALDSPVRDVAGMLRSFDYAARHLLVDADDPQRQYRAAEWADRNRDAFCTGYADVAGRDPRDDDVLLRAFETDKAVYEVVYEARNRPTWVGIPLAALDRLATQK